MLQYFDKLHTIIVFAVSSIKNLIYFFVETLLIAVTCLNKTEISEENNFFRILILCICFSFFFISQTNRRFDVLKLGWYATILNTTGDDLPP